MENPVKVIVLGCTRYDFQDRESQRQVVGCNVYFLEMTPGNQEDYVGFSPKKASLPVQSFDEISKRVFPITASPVLETSFTNKGPKTKIVDFEFGDPITFEVG